MDAESDPARIAAMNATFIVLLMETATSETVNAGGGAGAGVGAGAGAATGVGDGDGLPPPQAIATTEVRARTIFFMGSRVTRLPRPPPVGAC